MVTASGAPGTAALLRALRENGERELRLVGTDMSERSVGRHLCDAFHIVPGGADPTFPDAILQIAEQERVDAILPQSSFDLEGLSEHVARFPMPVLVSKPDTIRRSNDKAETYELLHRLGVKAPQFKRVNGAREVAAAAEELGYPDRPVCFKPVFSSGSRGFRVLDPTVDRAHQLLNERPGSVAMRLDEAVELLPDEGGPDLLVMELATGGEVTIDGIANGREIVLGHPKTREAMRAGLAMYFVTLDDPELMRVGNTIVEDLGDRALLQHPARRRLRDRDQPAHLDDRLPGRPEHPLPRRQARDRRDLGGRAAHVRVAHPPGPHGAALLRPARVRLMVPTSRVPGRVPGT